MAVVVPTSMALGLPTAPVLDDVAKRRPRLRAAHLPPTATTLMAMETVGQMLLHPLPGRVNEAVDALDLPWRARPSDRDLVVWTLTATGLRQAAGCNIVLFLAGLAAIPGRLHDAAAVDGAGRPWERFRMITCPRLGPVAVISATRVFRVFEPVATPTRGRPTSAPDTLVCGMRREGCVHLNAGCASAIAVVFLLFVLALAPAGIAVAQQAPVRPRGGFAAKPPDAP